MLSPTRRTGPSSSTFGGASCGAQEVDDTAARADRQAGSAGTDRLEELSSVRLHCAVPSIL